MRDAQPGELGGEPGQRHRQLGQPNPGGLVQPPGDAGGRDSGGRGKARADAFARQTESCSTTGSTGTTCRLNFSSDSVSPAATPTSCERWMIGRPNVRPVEASSF